MEDSIQKRISVVVPVYNEGKLVNSIIEEIQQKQKYQNEIIISFAGKDDFQIAQDSFLKAVKSSKGRSIQMNKGAEVAQFPVLFFLHADSVLPDAFDEAILKAIKEGYSCGCFQMKFDVKHPLLFVLGILTKVKSRWCRGGDQGLFVEQDLFKRIGGYDERLILFEDNEIIERLPFPDKFKVIPRWLVTSARKHKEIGVMRLNILYFKLHKAYRKGANQQELMNIYQRLVN